MPPPVIISAFLSVVPLEPVLVFPNSDEASYFQTRCKQGRILYDQQSNWVYLPMPKGLLRVRAAARGDVAFDFDSASNARHFNDSIKNLGRIYQDKNLGSHRDRRVYLGPQLL
ncbi:hypothetical protein DM02DRAFT_79387 [Periconia macrospinosa]|uniref:Uncharacterized protein n=1 Tax=Periconia macrospinosa TaxID=97972 RepID=A0A2V1DHH2_9PLEO|nr:hypothetical protein DM02DRAFT_79387 [Periconia macrospinosa]